MEYMTIEEAASDLGVAESVIRTAIATKKCSLNLNVGISVLDISHLKDTFRRVDECSWKEAKELSGLAPCRLVKLKTHDIAGLPGTTRLDVWDLAILTAELRGWKMSCWASAQDNAPDYFWQFADDPTILGDEFEGITPKQAFELWFFGAVKS